MEKLDITKSCYATENNQVKCSDYSLIFNVRKWQWITFQLPVALLHLNSSFSAFVFIYLIALILRQVKDVNILSIESMPSD